MLVTSSNNIDSLAQLEGSQVDSRRELSITSELTSESLSGTCTITKRVRHGAAFGRRKGSEARKKIVFFWTRNFLGEKRHGDLVMGSWWASGSGLPTDGSATDVTGQVCKEEMKIALFGSPQQGKRYYTRSAFSHF